MRRRRWRVVVDARWPDRAGAAYARKAARRRRRGGGRLGYVCDYQELRDLYAVYLWRRTRSRTQE